MVCTWGPSPCTACKTLLLHDAGPPKSRMPCIPHKSWSLWFFSQAPPFFQLSVNKASAKTTWPGAYFHLRPCCIPKQRIYHRLLTHKFGILIGKLQFARKKCCFFTALHTISNRETYTLSGLFFSIVGIYWNNRTLSNVLFKNPSPFPPYPNTSEDIFIFTKRQKKPSPRTSDRIIKSVSRIDRRQRAIQRVIQPLVGRAGRIL